MTFSDEQLERYARHIVLKEIGGEGQRKLAPAHSSTFIVLTSFSHIATSRL